MADLPDYQEEVVMVPMDEQQERMVQGVTDSLRSLAGAAMHSGSKGRLGTYIQAALAYPDHVWANQAIVDAQGNVLAEARGEWDASRVLPKEAQIVAYALREKARGRRSLVYCQFTGKYDVSRRLLRQFEDVGLKTAILTTDVPTEEREAWIAQRVREGVDVLICHPRLVATGLDLVEFPTILWAQTGYSLFEVRQASRRSWRLGQSEPVKVVFFAYEETAQETCLQILGDKLLAAQAVEGRFSAEGLQALSSGRNAALQLANALVYGLEGLKEVTEVWKAGQLVEAGPVVNPLEVLPSEPATDADTYQPSSLVGALVGTAPAQGSVMPSALTTLALRKPRRAKRASGQQALF
jgi:SNF2 family DNA or RNA helicase